MSKLNHKHFLLAVLAVSPLVALSPSKVFVQRTMASIEQESAIDDAIKEEAVADKDQDEVAAALAEVKEETPENEESKQCSAKDDIENLEKEVERVVAENMGLIKRFEKLNEKYTKDLESTKEKISPAPQMTNTEMLLFSMLGMLMQNQYSNQAPSYTYLSNPLDNAGNFMGPGWNYLPSGQNQFRSPGSFGHSSWEQDYYNMPSMGFFMNPALTPQADSLTTGLYPSVYSSNGQGRALRSVSEIAPARGYQPSYLAPDATSLRQNQTEGIAF